MNKREQKFSPPPTNSGSAPFALETPHGKLSFTVSFDITFENGRPNIIPTVTGADLGAGPGEPPRPPDDSEGPAIAIKVFQLLQVLDAEAGNHKAVPSTVLRLYCVDGLEPNQIARKLGCARSLVYSRLSLLRKKLGRDPAELRRYSSHIQNIEESLSDSRAKRIYRGGVIEGEDGRGENEG